VVQFLQGGMGGNEHQGAGLGAPALAFGLGAVYVESNQGHIGNDLSGLRGQNSVLAWRASAQANRVARLLAEEEYGTAARHAYVFGGSGGGLRAIECLERRPDLWDGAVPFIVNRNGLLLFNWSIHAWATSILGDRVADVVDATDAGGSGDPFATLDDEQRAALDSLYRAGYCRGAEWQIEPNPLWVMGMQIVQRSDPGFFRDFWEAPGYAGAEREPAVERLLVQGEGTVRSLPAPADLRARGVGRTDDIITNVLGRVGEGARLAVVLDGVERPDRLLGATLRLPGGREVLCTGAAGDALTAVLDPIGFADVEPGDRIAYDNRDLVAFAHFHRHFVSAKYPTMAHLLRDGVPVHPQRPIPLDAVPVPSGRFAGRMILVQHGADRECWPACATAYADDVRSHLGEATDDRFRLWWIEHAAHLVPLDPAGRTRVIEYAGCYGQALHDLVAWVEDGVAPAPSTAYDLAPDGRLALAGTAAERYGIQPVVTLAPARVEVAPGERFTLRCDVDVPPGAGAVVAIEWDLEGRGDWEREGGATLEHAYGTPGTRFVTVRVAVHRDGDGRDRLRRVQNLARARVVVR
jgi:hypothetical protein